MYPPVLAIDLCHIPFIQGANAISQRAI